MGREDSEELDRAELVYTWAPFPYLQEASETGADTRGHTSHTQENQGKPCYCHFTEKKARKPRETMFTVTLQKRRLQSLMPMLDSCTQM
jgi:hypothetical protein